MANNCRQWLMVKQFINVNDDDGIKVEIGETRTDKHRLDGDSWNHVIGTS